MSLVSVHNQFLHDITWLSSSSCDFNISGHTDIWRVKISDNLAHLDSFSALINTGETARAKRYLQPRDKNRFIISRGALRIILGKYLNMPPGLVEFTIGTNKKPFLKDAPLQYNVSHSGDWIVIAVSNAPAGVDIEQTNSSFDYRDIITEYFSADEAGYIMADDAQFRFFLLWTRKEALTKGTAKGLDDDLKLIPALDGEHAIEAGLLQSASDWQVNSFELYTGYLAAIATGGASGNLRFWNTGFF